MSDAKRYASMTQSTAKKCELVYIKAVISNLGPRHLWITWALYEVTWPHVGNQNKKVPYPSVGFHSIVICTRLQIWSIDIIRCG